MKQSANSFGSSELSQAGILKELDSLTEGRGLELIEAFLEFSQEESACHHFLGV